MYSSVLRFRTTSYCAMKSRRHIEFTREFSFSDALVLAIAQLPFIVIALSPGDNTDSQPCGLCEGS